MKILKINEFFDVKTRANGTPSNISDVQLNEIGMWVNGENEKKYLIILGQPGIGKYTMLKNIFKKNGMTEENDYVNYGNAVYNLEHMEELAARHPNAIIVIDDVLPDIKKPEIISFLKNSENKFVFIVNGGIDDFERLFGLHETSIRAESVVVDFNM